MPVNPKPAELPRWADVGGGAGIADPSSAVKDAGWLINQKPPAQWMNWLFNLLYQWCAYVFDFENNVHTWAANQIFNSGSGGLVTWTGAQTWLSNSPWLTIDNTGIGVQNARQALFLKGANNTDPLVSLAGAVLSITNSTGIGSAIRASTGGTGAVTAWLTNGGDSSFALRLYEAAADNLGVALDIILNSTNGTALQAVGTSAAAFFALFSNNGNAASLKVENTGAGRALEVGAGDVFFSGGAAAAATAQANRLSKGLVPKAWAVYTTNGSGGVTLLAGQNIAAIAIVSSTNGNGVQLTWASAFTSVDQVCVVGNCMHGGAPGVANTINPQVSANLDTKVNVGHWEHNPVGPVVSFLNAATQQIRGFVVVFGLQ
jgi:hypothetical protein